MTKSTSPVSDTIRLAISQIRSQALGLEAVALDLERMGLAAIATRQQIQTLRAGADEMENGGE